MLVYMGGQFITSQETHRADELYQRGYEIGREQHDPELMADAQCQRAYGDAHSGIYQEAPQRLAEARQLLTRIDHPDADLQANCLMAESVVEQSLGNGRRPRRYCEGA